MEANTLAPPQSPQSPDDPPTLPAGAPQEVHDAVAGRPLNAKGEKTALGWLLGATTPLPYWVDVKYDTPDGLLPLRFHMIQIDSTELDKIEKQHRVGDGPFAELNQRTYNAAVVTAATRYIEDLGDGTRISPTDPEFRGPIPDPAIAMEKRFAFQPGLLRGIVAEVREMAGNSEDRIGTAQRALVDAAGNS